MNTLKEQNGRYYQKCQVVMLTTKNKSDIYLTGYKNILDTLVFKGSSTECLFQHLYILSDEEIKEGDWVYNIDNKVIYQMHKHGLPVINLANKKIIATTDWNSLSQTSRNEIPKPSDSFIKKYIEEYNKDNQITNVLVEYEKEYQVENFHNGYTQWVKEPINFIENNKSWFQKQDKVRVQLKIDSDNTITIKKIKDSYSREEVYKLLYNAIGYGASQGESIDTRDAENWINKNL